MIRQNNDRSATGITSEQLSRMHARRSNILLQAVLLLVTTMLLSAGCSSVQSLFGLSTTPADGSLQEQARFSEGLAAYERGSYADAIHIFEELLGSEVGTAARYETHWMLAKSYEDQGDWEAALREYRLFRSTYPQTAHGNEAQDKLQALQQRLPVSSVRSPAIETTSAKEYRIGEEDELEISVYADDDLIKTQTVRPDGKIAFPLIGDLQAKGLTPAEVREQVTQRLYKFVKNPQVTVIVSKYNSNQVYVLGQVRTPGVLRLSSDITVVQAISRVGGTTDDADLQGALLIRDSQILPVSFDKLLQHGDFTQNVLLRPNDAILIPNASAKKVFVLGEVKLPLAISIRHPVTLIEAISMAGGFTADAKSRNVVVARGGLGAANILKVNVDDITEQGLIAKNMLLQPNDIVYVPKSIIAEVSYYAQKISSILTPIILTEFGISLYPTVKSVIETGKPLNQQIVPIPQPQP